jgi:FAD/FMN-containing dehydrogenase
VNRRRFLQHFSALGTILPRLTSGSAFAFSSQTVKRVRPSDALWPSPKQWEVLGGQLEGGLTTVDSPLAACAEAASVSCRNLIKDLQNPYFLGDQPGATQIWGWANAWTFAQSAYVVRAKTARDVALAVNFARKNNLRLVVKGGGHSYQGTSNAPDSLLIWTRALNAVALHDEFVCRRAPAHQESTPAVTVGAGAVWMDVYDVVTTKGGRYVQGGGCATVGVAGLIQSGGFGSFSKGYGLAASHLLEAEIVTADGEIRVANNFQNADLFWAIKGGGGGTFGVVTRLTLKTHELPAIFGDISVKIKAASDGAFRKLISVFLDFYQEKLFNRHWGESVRFGRNNVLSADLTFQDLEKQEANAVWQKFLHAVAALPDMAIESPFFIEALPAQKWWDVDYLEKYSTGSVLLDPRPGAPRHHAWWTGDKDQAGSFIQAYKSTWLPATLLDDGARGRLCNALFAGSRHWTISLHFNKGLAGCPHETVSQARNTAINPTALDAFALAIMSADSPATYSGELIKNPDVEYAKEEAARIARAMDELKGVAPNGGSYVAESDYFEADWQKSFWGSNYERLRKVKRKYDAGGLFFVHHGIGSEEWSEDGFTRRA